MKFDVKQHQEQIHNTQKTKHAHLTVLSTALLKQPVMSPIFETNSYASEIS